jgi:hypothetical protein
MRNWSDHHRAFLRMFTVELEQFGYIRRNNTSIKAAMAYQVQMSNSNEYCMIVDNRWLNRDTIPIAGDTPNLAVVTQTIRGAYGIDQFDWFKGC